MAQAAGLTDEQIEEYVHHHNPERHVHHIQSKMEDIADHPDVKAFAEWSKQTKVYRSCITAVRLMVMLRRAG